MKKGVLAVVVASFLYGVMPIFTKRAMMIIENFLWIYQRVLYIDLV